ncbi:hypothetical protein ACHMW6_25915 [Pseudoduganella sp. UC29_106]|uniref:hypothetical protein n=1 Tax=Pseudoduganella sp. UC29_106 TaxID=3374553 RepID=UPI003757EF76
MSEEISIALRSDQHYVQVHALSELEYLVKESEIVTGCQGRLFHIRSQDRPVRISLEFGGFVIRNMGRDTGSRAMYLPRRLMMDALIGHALRSGMLFTRRLAG